MRGSSYWALSHQTVAFCFRIIATYEVGELPERVDEERRRAPLLERFGVPLVELVDEVGVRRRPPWYCVGYCEFIVVVGDAVVVGNMPELVVRDREWPSCASEYICCVGGGRTPTPGLGIGLRRTGRGPKGAGEGAAITAVCMVFDCVGDLVVPDLMAIAESETRISSALTSRGSRQRRRLWCGQGQ